MRIVVDTNVIVSALVFGGLPRRVFETVEADLASRKVREDGWRCTARFIGAVLLLWLLRFS